MAGIYFSTSTLITRLILKSTMSGRYCFLQFRAEETGFTRSANLPRLHHWWAADPVPSPPACVANVPEMDSWHENTGRWCNPAPLTAASLLISSSGHSQLPHNQEARQVLFFVTLCLFRSSWGWRSKKEGAEVEERLKGRGVNAAGLRFREQPGAAKRLAVGERVKGQTSS